MDFKASKLQNIDDFIDCALFKIPYIAVDADYIVSKNKTGFGSLISTVPLRKSQIVLESHSELVKTNKALTMCNANIIQFNHDVDLDLLSNYKKNYLIWKLITNEKEVKKYSDICDAFVINYEDIDSLLENKDIMNKFLIIRANDKNHIEKISNLMTRNFIVDVNYRNEGVYNFENNHLSSIDKN